MLRHPLLEFPEDPVVPHLDTQYMLGDSLLVAPVLHETRSTYHLPQGDWTDLWTGEVISGPKHVVEEDCPIDRIPVFVRPGSVLLLGPLGVDVPDYNYGTVQLEVRSYQLQADVAVDVPSGVGSEILGQITVSHNGQVDNGGFNVSVGDTTSSLV